MVEWVVNLTENGGWAEPTHSKQRQDARTHARHTTPEHATCNARTTPEQARADQGTHARAGQSRPEHTRRGASDAHPHTPERHGGADPQQHNYAPMSIPIYMYMYEWSSLPATTHGPVWMITSVLVHAASGFLKILLLLHGIGQAVVDLHLTRL